MTVSGATSNQKTKGVRFNGGRSVCRSFPRFRVGFLVFQKFRNRSSKSPSMHHLAQRYVTVASRHLRWHLHFLDHPCISQRNFHISVENLSGHSKWSKIKHSKGTFTMNPAVLNLFAAAVDNAKQLTWNKRASRITVAVKRMTPVLEDSLASGWIRS